MARGLLVVALALVLAVQVIRNSVVSAFVDRNPDIAERAWQTHPAAEISLGMTEIGRAAKQRQPVPSAIFLMMNDAAGKAPLAPEPFLVRGVQMQLAGTAPLAIDAFAAAARRDPRSLPAHYFLADALFRAGDTRRGLREIGILARLAPGGVASLAPYVATYAKDRRTWPQLRELFRSEPALEETTLTALAGDAANADTVLALAKEQGGPTAPWLPSLVNGLVGAQQYEKAHQIWARVSGVRGLGLYDGNFVAGGAPAPFNWTLTSATVGLAERIPRGGLHVIFYGREDGVLARQLLVLSPGAYHMSMAVAGSRADAHPLTWSLRCDGLQTPISAIPLDIAGSKSWAFSVPAGCPAQWLELSGVSTDVARQSEVTVRNLRLIPERPNG
jgi:hypothetical protein